MKNYSYYTYLLSKKLLSLDRLEEIHLDHKSCGLKTGVCLGCFDYLHAGHILHLSEARGRCDSLFVLITSDKEVGKGADRPVLSEAVRASLVASLEVVDFCCVRPPGERSDGLLARLKPSFYFKGQDYIDSREKSLVREAEAVRLAGGQMVFTESPIYKHTTDLLEE